MTRDARREPSHPGDDESLPAGAKRRPTLPFGMPAVRPTTDGGKSAARVRPSTTRPTTRPRFDVADEPDEGDLPAARRVGGFALEAEDEAFLSGLARQLHPSLAWLLGDRRRTFDRELLEGRLDAALEILLSARRDSPRNVSITQAAHAMRDAIRDHVRERVGPMDAVPFLVREPPSLTRSHVKVLPLVNGVSTVEDIIGSCQLPILETIRSMSRLLKVGCITVPGGPAAGRSAPQRTRPQGDEEPAAASSRLTMPEILAPFAADLEALGVGSGRKATPSPSAVVGGATTSRAAREPIADPTTPVPGGDDDEPAPSTARAAEASSSDWEARPTTRMAVEDAATTDDDEAALQELGAIWRARATRKSEPATAPPAAAPGEAAADREPDDPPEPVQPPKPDPNPDASPADEPIASASRSSRPAFPSIPALEPPDAPDDVEPRPRLSSPTRARTSIPASTRARGGSTPRFALIVGGVTALVLIGMFALRARPTEPDTALAPSTPAATPSPPPPRAADPPPALRTDPMATDPSYVDRGTVTFTIKVTPKYARVFLDDVLLLPNSEVKLRREDKDHVLRVEAPGFATRELTASSKADASLVVALDRAAGSPAGGPEEAPSKKSEKKPDKKTDKKPAAPPKADPPTAADPAPAYPD